MGISIDIGLEDYTTFGIPAKAKCFVEYANSEELERILSNTLLPRPLKPIGEGSNLLFCHDFPGTILRSTDKTIEFEFVGDGTVFVKAGAGLSLDELAEECCKRGLWGLENLSGIPGTVGASVVQNVGAYGVEISDVTIEATLLDTKENKICQMPQTQMEHSYRNSVFKATENACRYIVLDVTYRLSSNPAPVLEYGHLKSKLNQDVPLTPMMVRDTVIAMRDEKLPSPSFKGSAGSFFKNPIVDEELFARLTESNGSTPPPHFKLDENSIKIPAAWLIDKCGLKGRTSGGAKVWEKQPLVIVNDNGMATAADVLALESEIIAEVRHRFGIELSPEVEHV